MRGKFFNNNIFSKITIVFFAVIFGLLSLSLVDSCLRRNDSMVFAQDYDTGWVINNFTSNITIDKNQHTKVIETIDVDFGNMEKHGIYRDIPYKYSRNGNNYYVRIEIDSVTDANGQDIAYDESKSGGNIELKIGDPDTTISGKQTYKISYELDRVINHFSDHDEFYWNATGTDWPVTIEKAGAQITWPDGAEFTQNICYTGTSDSSAQNCQYNTEKNTASFISNQSLYPGEGFTIASGIKPGILTNYPFSKVFGWFIADNWIYLLPFIVLIFLLYKYFKGGRDPKGKTTIAPEFAPPQKLLPAELGTIYDERVDPQDISAVIIDLAVWGYIKIAEIKKSSIFSGKDYEFSQTKKSETSLTDYEKEILDELGNKKLSELKNKFYTHVKSIKDKLYAKVTKEKYFVANPESVRNSYFGVAGVLLFIAIIGAFWIYQARFGLSVGVSAALLFIFAGLMPRRTEQGVEILRQIKGFRLYMNTAERYRQKFNEDKHIFEKFLPYAMVFGITKKWAKAFEGMQVPKPDWYVGSGAFYPVLFVANISSLQNSMNSTLISPPSSAGGGGSGFSGGGVGGGFGGGGGGSW